MTQSQNQNEKDQDIPGKKYGKWTLGIRLGGGGNGEVWEAKCGDGSVYAIKILKRIKNKGIQRFRAEIDVLSRNTDIIGIVPLIDRHIDAEDIGCTPWYVMPMGIDFDTYRKERKNAIQLVSAFVELAETIEILHSRNISHRDIKPANLLYYNGRLCLTDFGLVKYPDRKDITLKREDVGPKFTMAPEMRRIAEKADGLKADVYSFSKTLWIALTNENLCFDGQYSANTIIGLGKYHPEQYLSPLENLLVAATDNDPMKRPTIGQFRAGLIDWINLNLDFHKRNLTEWFEIQNILFPLASPKSAEWITPNSIVSILNQVARSNSLNHMFYPSGGGNTIEKASLYFDNNMIELQVAERMICLLKPRKLTFESFGFDPKWNYFRLEAEEIPPLNIENTVSSDGIYQALAEVSLGNFTSPDCFEYNEFEGNPLPSSARIVTRYLKGAFVFFCTSSTYNRDTSTYDARHNKMSELTFREYIARNAKVG